MDIPHGPLTPASSSVDASEKSVRALGWLLVVLGVGLAIGTALVAYLTRNAIAHGDRTDGHLHWNGNAAMTRVVFQLFGVLFFFGLDALAAGIYQVQTGRRNPWLLGILVLLLLAIPLFGLVLIVTAQHPR